MLRLLYEVDEIHVQKKSKLANRFPAALKFCAMWLRAWHLNVLYDVIASKMADERPILVTGFGPFRGHPVNSSWAAVQDMKENHTIEHKGRQIPFVIREIPVVYETVKTEIPKLWDEVKPRLCVHVGVAGRTQAIRLEKYARNVGYNSTDIHRKVPDNQVCVHEGPDEICTQFNIEQICQKASEKLTDIQFISSSDAGRYLCDFIYYTSLHLNQGPVLFVHVPDLDNPYSKQQLSLALKHILECLLQEMN